MQDKSNHEPKDFTNIPEFPDGVYSTSKSQLSLYNIQQAYSREELYSHKVNVTFTRIAKHITAMTA